MKKLSLYFTIAVLISSIFIIPSCEKSSDPSNSTPNISDGRITIINDQTTLADEIVYQDVDVEIDTTGFPPGALGKLSDIQVLKLRSRAHINSLKNKNQDLQATHIVINGTTAYVSYNMRGDTYLGGVYVIDISNSIRPKIISSAIFDGTDISSLYFDSGKLYLAEATQDTGFIYPAAIEEITLDAQGLLTLNSRRKGVPSYVATDIKVSGGKIWVTSGSGGPGTGGLTILDAATLDVISSDLFLDARSLDFGTIDGIVSFAVLQGTPARMRTYNAASNAFLASYTAVGATIPESKSTIDVVLDRAFVAAGDGGIKVFSFQSKTVIDSLPQVTVNGLSSDLTVTNAVSVSNSYVFAANGEAGVYVAQSSIDLESIPTTNPSLQYVGSLKFKTKESANFVASSSNILFVASGLGGLDIVEIQ